MTLPDMREEKIQFVLSVIPLFAAPLTSNVVSTAKQFPTILATCCLIKERHRIYEEKGCYIVTVQKNNGHVDLVQLMDLLGQKQIDSILLEGEEH